MKVNSNACVWLVAAALLAGGCDALKIDDSRFLSPSAMIKSPDRAFINPILSSVTTVDPAEELVPGATLPREGDWTYTEEDYVIGPMDVLNVAILDLYQDGLETTLQRQVSESGFIDLPLLTENIKATGLTSEQLIQVIKDAYSPQILQDPTVSVAVALQRSNMFNVLGSVARPGAYNITRRDMRVLDALALAGGVGERNIRYIYVFRSSPAVKVEADTGAPAAQEPQELVLPEIPEELIPAQPAEPNGTATQPAENDGLQELEKALQGQDATQPAPSVTPMLAVNGAADAEGPLEQPAQSFKWVYTDGRWVRVQQEPAAAPPAEQQQAQPAQGAQEQVAAEPQAPADEQADPFGWQQLRKDERGRIIAINLSKLMQGDPRMNVVIRDGDVVHVPLLDFGEFYVSGEVLRPGAYTLTGRRVTIKMALAAAAGASPLAWPENSVLVRRIGDDQEQMIPLNIEAIFHGRDPDIFLKPNDLVAIGTNWRSPFLVVMANAFRMTYGFGFIYDRNFSDPLLVTPTSNRFSRL